MIFVLICFNVLYIVDVYAVYNVRYMQTKCHLQNVQINELLLLKFINYYFRRAHLKIKKLTAKGRVETSLCIPQAAD